MFRAVPLLIWSRSSTVWTKLGNKARRLYVTWLAPDYLEAQKEIRFGDCSQCGRCCKFVFRCPFLKEMGDDHSLCEIYHLGRPYQCAAFPMDERDLADVDFHCGYFFLTKDEATRSTTPSS